MFRQTNGPWRVRISYLAPCVFFPGISLIIGRWPGGPDLLEACMRPPPLHLFSTLEAPRFDFYQLKTTSKNSDFSTRPEINKNNQ